MSENTLNLTSNKTLRVEVLSINKCLNVLFSSLNEVLEALGKIPILPALQLNAEAHRFSAFDVFEDTDFEGPHYRITHPLDNSSENKACQDFGVEAFKLSDEDGKWFKQYMSVYRVIITLFV